MHLPSLRLQTDSRLAAHFMPHQVNWIQAEDPIHSAHQTVFALAEKSVRIGWTRADAFKNVRKRLRFPNRDYLFVTKDYPSALEYLKIAWKDADLFNLTCAILSHGEEYIKVPRLDRRGRSTAFTEEVKVGVIKFENGSRILAFSSNPQAMAVYGGDVGLDEFAKHPNAALLWETAQGRITWGFDLAVWSAHNGDDTLFYQFAQQARLACSSENPRLSSVARQGEGGSSLELPLPPTTSSIAAAPDPSHPPHLPQASHSVSQPSLSAFQGVSVSALAPWNLYYHITMPDALAFGLADKINQARGTRFTPAQFLAQCRARAGSEHIYQQTYLCNPLPSGATIVDWSVLERCRADYPIERLHLEATDILSLFNTLTPGSQSSRESAIRTFLHEKFPLLFKGNLPHSALHTQNSSLLLGFDIAATGHGDLASFYIDRADSSRDPELWLSALFTCRTDDWHFLKTVLFAFLRDLHNLRAAGDETGLGKQICWEAARQFGSRFLPVNFRSQKHDLGHALMNQLAAIQKRLPTAHPDIAADLFALRKNFTANRWTFSETPNPLNPNSHCDIAWSAALASHAHTHSRRQVWAATI